MHEVTILSSFRFAFFNIGARRRTGCGKVVIVVDTGTDVHRVSVPLEPLGPVRILSGLPFRLVRFTSKTTGSSFLALNFIKGSTKW